MSTVSNIKYIDLASLDAICSNQEEIAVYGTDGCYYYDLSAKLQFVRSRVYTFGAPAWLDLSTSFERIDTGKVRSGFKNLLVTVVFENFKRSALNRPLIPILFCIESETFKIDFAEILNRKLDSSHYHTSSELRRAYKLCAEFPDERINQIASDTFKFAKVTNSPEGFQFELLPHPWTTNEWKTGWENRQKEKVPEFTSPLGWKVILMKKVSLFEQSQKAVTPTRSSTNLWSRVITAGAIVAAAALTNYFYYRIK